MPKKRTSLLTYCLVALWLGFWFVVIAQAVAQAEPAIDLPSDNEDRLTLGQGMVAEVDFEAPAEHAALGYALKRRWQSLRDKGSDVTFSDYIKSYIAAFSKKKANNPRVKWVKQLDLEGNEPANWPTNLRWSRYRPLWLKTLERAQGVLDGTLKDPCGGERSANQWGARDLEADKIRAARALAAGRWVLARCSMPTANVFYHER